MKATAITDVSAQFEQLVKEHTGELLRFAASRTRDVEAAEDIVQLTFMAAWQGRERFSHGSSVRTWLFRILKNKLADHYREIYRKAEVISPYPDDVERFNTHGGWLPEHRPVEWDDDAAQDGVMHHALNECLKTLPDKWRAAVEMKFLKERDAPAICQELGISATNYWQQLHRAKLKLRGCIEKLMRLYRD